MTFTIITATYNSSKTIQKTMNSVLNQSFKDFEYIIVDGNSTDDTLEKINQLQEKFEGKLTIISEPDTGIYDAFNKGLKRASGDIVGIINSDDWYEEDALSIIKESYTINGCPKYSIFYGGIKLYRESESEYYQIYMRHHNDLLSHGHMIAHPACFVTRDVYEKVGYFDTDFTLAADQDFMTRCVLGRVSFTPIESVLANFKEGGATSQNGKLLELESIKICTKHELVNVLKAKHPKLFKPKNKKFKFWK